MHMADALLSPAVGGVMIAVSAGAIGYSVKKVAGDPLGESKIPMMGVMGAFVFAAQMINFTVPGTGSSGHIGGGLLLAALLGPFPALVTMASVLLIQCLLFADGGLLAYGCNVFNLGVCGCLLAYAAVYRPMLRRGVSKRKLTAASVLSVVLGLQAGAFCVVLETLASGVTGLPFGLFALLMQPIHLAIGLVEGLVTAAVLCFVHRARPELVEGANAENGATSARSSMRKVIVPLLAVTVAAGGGLSLLASPLPDGLEWSLENAAGTADVSRESAVHDAVGTVADATVLMPDYNFAGDEQDTPSGTAAAGILGSAVTLALACGIGLLIRAARKKRPRAPSS